MTPIKPEAIDLQTGEAMEIEEVTCNPFGDRVKGFVFGNEAGGIGFTPSNNLFVPKGEFYTPANLTRKPKELK